MGEMVVIESIEQSTMASTWTEFLCLQKTSDNRWRLDIRGYEVLGEAWEHQDEDGELPEEIGGKRVVGTEDGLVVVDRLVLHSEDYPVYEFDRFDPEEFKDLFEYGNGEWCTDVVITRITKTVENAQFSS